MNVPRFLHPSLPLLLWFVPVLFCAGLLPPAGAVEEGDLRVFDLGGGVKLEAVRIRAGIFTMGSPPAEPGRNEETETPRRVTLTRDFLMGVTPVTRGQWKRFAADTEYLTEAEEGTSGGFGWDGAKLVQRREFTWKNPGFPQTDDHPAVILTAGDARKFMQWLSSLTGLTFALPSEAQWEYACRGGTETAWWMDDEAVDARRAVWSLETAGNGTHPVQSRPPNVFGLHIAGNVQEWCADWFAPYIASLPATDPIQTTPPAGDKARQVLRGGGWLRPLKEARSAARWRNDPGSRNADNGFRVMSFGVDNTVVAQTPPVPPAAAETVPQPPPPAAASERQRHRVVMPDEDPSEPAPASPSSGKDGGGIPWLWLIFGGGLIYWIYSRIRGRGKGKGRDVLEPAPEPPLPYGLDEEPGALTEAGRLRQAVIPPGSFQARPAADGFWLQAGYPAGTWLLLQWREGEGGYERDRQVRYEPGDDGQFIYTGMAPEDIRVTEAEDEDGGDDEENEDTDGVNDDGGNRTGGGRRRHRGGGGFGGSFPVIPPSPQPDFRQENDPPFPPPPSRSGGVYRPSAY